jgi:hypothetical protein
VANSVWSYIGDGAVAGNALSCADGDSRASAAVLGGGNRAPAATCVRRELVPQYWTVATVGNQGARWRPGRRGVVSSFMH